MEPLGLEGVEPPELPPPEDGEGIPGIPEEPEPPLEGDGMLGEGPLEPLLPPDPPEDPDEPPDEGDEVGEGMEEDDWPAQPPMSIADTPLTATMFAVRTANRLSRC